MEEINVVEAVEMVEEVVPTEAKGKVVETLLKVGGVATGVVVVVGGVYLLCKKIKAKKDNEAAEEDETIEVLDEE